jgi:hypothetical protein
MIVTLNIIYRRTYSNVAACSFPPRKAFAYRASILPSAVAATSTSRRTSTSNTINRTLTVLHTELPSHMQSQSKIHHTRIEQCCCIAHGYCNQECPDNRLLRSLHRSNSARIGMFRCYSRRIHERMEKGN